MPNNISECWQTVDYDKGDWVESFYGRGFGNSYIGAYRGSCIHRRENTTCWASYPLLKGEKKPRTDIIPVLTKRSGR